MRVKHPGAHLPAVHWNPVPLPELLIKVLTRILTCIFLYRPPQSPETSSSTYLWRRKLSGEGFSKTVVTFTIQSFLGLFPRAVDAGWHSLLGVHIWIPHFDPTTCNPIPIHISYV